MVFFIYNQYTFSLNTTLMESTFKPSYIWNWLIMSNLIKRIHWLCSRLMNSANVGSNLALGIDFQCWAIIMFYVIMYNIVEYGESKFAQIINHLRHFLCPTTKKVAGYYVIPSEILRVRSSVHQRPHHSLLLFMFNLDCFQSLYYRSA